MSSYLIKKNKETNEITYMSYDFEGYNFKPKNKSKYLNVNNIMVVKPSMISKILQLKFNKLYNNTANIILEYLASDDEEDDGTCEILIGEVDRLKSLYLAEYKKHVEKEENLRFLEKLNFLRNELEEKQLRITKNLELNYDYEISRGKSR